MNDSTMYMCGSLIVVYRNTKKEVLRELNI